MRRIAAALLLSFIVAPMALATALRPGPSLFDMAFNPLFGGIVAVFDLNPSTTGSGPSLLTDAVAMNGQTMTLLASCDARNAGATWTCTGLSSAMTRTGAALTQTQTTPFSETAARELKGNGATYYTSAVGDVEVGSSDFIVEFVRRKNTGVLDSQIIGRNSGVNTAGWEIYSLANGTLGFQTRGSSGVYRGTTFETAPPDGQWSYYMIGYDSSAAQAFTVVNNGNVVTSSHTAVADLSNASGRLGFYRGRVGSSSISFDALAFVRIWKCTDCLDSSSFQTEARRRFARAAGVFPSSTADPTMTFARASTGYVDNYNGTAHVLNLVGSGWPRVASRLDTGSTMRTGYIAEPQSTNIVLQSEAMETALNWTATNVVAVNGTSSPISTATGESVESPDALGSVEHYVRQSVTLTAATYAFSGYIRGGTANFGWLRNATIANGTAWINLSTCGLTTKQAGIIAYYGQTMTGGWCRFAITFTGTAAAHNLDIGYSNADNVTAYDDGTNATVDANFWGAQVEQQDIPTSYIVTTTASATRLADALTFAAPTNGGTLETQVVTDAHVATVAPFSFATTAQGALAPFCNTATTDWRVNDATNGASITSGVACITGVPTTIRQTIATATGSILYRDGTSIGTDATVSFGPLTGGTTITAGATRGLLMRGRIWSQPYTPTEAP